METTTILTRRVPDSRFEIIDRTSTARLRRSRFANLGDPAERSLPPRIDHWHPGRLERRHIVGGDGETIGRHGDGCNVAILCGETFAGFSRLDGQFGIVVGSLRIEGEYAPLEQIQQAFESAGQGRFSPAGRPRLPMPYSNSASVTLDG
jgi:hypothetical protein